MRVSFLSGPSTTRRASRSRSRSTTRTARPRRTIWPKSSRPSTPHATISPGLTSWSTSSRSVPTSSAWEVVQYGTLDSRARRMPVGYWRRSPRSTQSLPRGWNVGCGFWSRRTRHQIPVRQASAGHSAHDVPDAVDGIEVTVVYLLDQGKITIEQRDAYGEDHELTISLKDAADIFDWPQRRDRQQ